MNAVAVVCACNPPAIWREVVTRLCRASFAAVVVVDDGSATPLAFQPAHDCRAPFKLLRCPGNIGLAAARNHALSQIDAEWILFVDSDVLPFESFLTSLPDRLRAASADGLGFQVHEHHRESDWDFFRACEREASKSTGPAEWVSGLLCAYRSEALREMGGFDPAFRTNGEDVDLGFRLTSAGRKLVQIPEICGEHYRKDSLRSFLRMHHRYALTAKRVDRSLYFPDEKSTVSNVPLFRWRTAWPQVRQMFRSVRRRPRAFYLPPLVLAAMLFGAWKGRRVIRQGPGMILAKTEDAINPAHERPLHQPTVVGSNG